MTILYQTAPTVSSVQILRCSCGLMRLCVSDEEERNGLPQVRYSVSPSFSQIEDPWRYTTKKKKKSLKESQNTPTPTIQSLKQPRRIITKIFKGHFHFCLSKIQRKITIHFWQLSVFNRLCWMCFFVSAFCQNFFLSRTNGAVMCLLHFCGPAM